jgi:MoaA/NifB/PqqE/SkfB family radical SAM enzyme
VKKAGSSCVVYTNGTLLNHEKIDEIIKMKADELRVSIMAGTRDTYMHTHVGIRDDTFDVLRDNLLYLKEQKAAKGAKRPVVTLINVITSLNYQGLYDFTGFAHQVGADKVSFQPFDTLSDKALSKMELTDEQARSVREQLMESKTFLSSRSIVNNADIFLKFFQRKLDTMELYHIIPCYIGWLGIRLQLNGEVNICCRCYESLGNIFEESIEEIWYGKSYRKFRKEVFEINKRNTPVPGCDCNTCPHYSLNLRVYQALHPFKGRHEELNTYSERSV